MAKLIASLQKRSFLNPVSTNETSYINAVVESTRDGEYPWGTNQITIADCKRVIMLEFFLGTAEARRFSLAKIDLLINFLTAFRDQLRKEANRIEAYREPRNTKKKT